MSVARKVSNAPALPRRAYGSTGIELSIVGFGGIVVMNAEQDHANRVVAEAVERGVNYFDVAPGYGNAEEILGPALEPYRKDCFLACKTHERRREAAEASLARSLERLKTDHFDLYQLHGLCKIDEDLDVAFGKDGAMEVFMQAKKDGRVRHLGFSAHSEEVALEAMDRFDFDSVLFPISFAPFFKHGFGVQVLGKAEEKGMAGLALKALARQMWPEDDPLRATYQKTWYQPLTNPRHQELALRFTLSQGVTAAVSPGEEALLRRAIDIAMAYTPITPDEEAELRTLAGEQTAIFPQKF